VIKHWQTRSKSVRELCDLKETRLRWSLWGFLGPAAYFAVQHAHELTISLRCRDAVDRLVVIAQVQALRSSANPLLDGPSPDARSGEEPPAGSLFVVAEI
jgi:hypothetical protein